MRKTATRLAACTLSAAMTLALVPGAAFAETTQPASGGATSQESTAQAPATGTTSSGESSQNGTGAGTGTQTGGETTTDKAVTELQAAIEALPELGKATHDDNAAIKKTYKQYKDLTAAQKAQVDAGLVTKLTKLHDAYEKAAEVSEQMAAAIKSGKQEALQSAEKAYEALPKSTRALIDPARTEKLPYATTPSLTYTVKSTGGTTTTVTDSKAHTFKGGLGKIKVSQPRSGVDGKKKLDATVSYGIKTYNGKDVAAHKAGKWIGSTSSGKTEQAFKLNISGTLASHYTAYYRVKVSKVGWSDWASGGKWAGSTGMNLRITGLQVKFEKKDAKAPGSTANPSLGPSSLSYRVNAVSGGWTSYKKHGGTAGTASWKAGIKQVEVTTSGDLDGSAQTSVLGRKGGWTSYKSGVAGSSSKSKQAQAVRIKLTGELSKVYNVYYRVYASDYHWLGWAKNGQKAGTQGHGYSMGAIQVRLRLKGTGAPGSTAKHFTTKAVPSYSGGELTMVHKAQNYSSSTGWLILVNRGTTQVGVFTGSKGNWKLKKYFNCDVGAPSTPTPKGTRYVRYKQRSFGEDKGYSVYKATNIGGGYFFHSIIYDANTMNVQDGVLGQWRSHGCVRLAFNNAKYIYDHVPVGTTVKIY